MLEHEETLALIALAQKDDESAKVRLIEHNSPLVKSIIRHYKNKRVEYDDLYQIGCMGFLKAVKNFDISYNVRFSTYAVPMIAGEIKRFLRDDGYIKVSRSLKTLAHKISAFVENYKKEHLAEPSIEKIAKEFEIEPQEVVFAMDSGKLPISLFEKTDDGEKSQNLIDKIAVEDNNDEIIDRMILKSIIGELTPREKKIIILRYYRDKTQSEIAEHLGISQVQVSRLESKILEKIKAKLRVN
jgi:RNA polymerase sporulation-specific sigma factor